VLTPHAIKDIRIQQRKPKEVASAPPAIPLTRSLADELISGKVCVRRCTNAVQHGHSDLGVAIRAPALFAQKGTIPRSSAGAASRLSKFDRDQIFDTSARTIYPPYDYG
jgi:hypothetical protein